MMEIPDCTGAPVCSRCGPVAWLYSARRGAWVAFLAKSKIASKESS